MSSRDWVNAWRFMFFMALVWLVAAIVRAVS